MFSYFALLAAIAVPALSYVFPRQDADHPFQFVPTHATTPDNQYTRGDIAKSAGYSYFIGPERVKPPPKLREPPAEYQSRPIDIPFALLNKGGLKFFKNGQFASPEGAETDEWDPNKTDFANNSACGIPDNAYYLTRVEIHPYWLEFAPANLGLSRYCMQDACISLWNETGAGNKNGSTDVELKITGICSTDPNDPSYCETPADIMIDRQKAMLLFRTDNKTAEETAALKYKNAYPRPVNWFFSKCLQDGLPQKAYNHSGNWFATPPLPLNTNWSMRSVQEQQHNNILKGAYQNHDPPLPTYEMGAYIPDDKKRESLVFPLEKYWEPGQKTPDWCPVAGGRGHTKPPGDCPGWAESSVEKVTVS